MLEEERLLVSGFCNCPLSALSTLIALSPTPGTFTIPTSYLQHQFARPIVRHNRQVEKVLNKDLVGKNVAAVLTALVH